MKTKNFNSILLFAMIVTSIVALAISLSSPSPVHAALTSHAPIYINGNDDFTPANGVTSGSGTENDPYIIENWDINVENANGIWIENTTAYFTIRSCYLHGTAGHKRGISFDNVKNGRIDNNLVENTYTGILLEFSDNIIMRNNTLLNNEFNFSVYGTTPSDFVHDIDASNLVNSKPIRYLVGNKNEIIGPSLDIGYLALVNCDNIHVENLALSNHNGQGILLAYTENVCIDNCDLENNAESILLLNSNNSILMNNNLSNNRAYGIILVSGLSNTMKNNRVENNYFGIYLMDASNNNTITNNWVSGNGDVGICIVNSLNNTILNNNSLNNYLAGISLYISSNNVVENNRVENHCFCGIDLSGENDGENVYYSSNNTLANNNVENNYWGIGGVFLHNNKIVNNNVSNNYLGIHLRYSSDNNHIYHNNFVNNDNQAHDDGTNKWDDGYPSGGNYWSDYTGKDNYLGENQNILGSDGIGDTPYAIPSCSNMDRYPLANPVVGGLVSHPPIYINGDDNFTSVNSVTFGSGTENDPYIIENWAIDAENAHGIWIRNTTVHFIVRNCLVENGYFYGFICGVYLENVENGRVEDCILRKNGEGILLDGSSNNVLDNNTCKDFDGIGIQLSYSPNNILSNNICENNQVLGIHLRQSDNNILYNNAVEKTGYGCGIWIEYSSNNTFRNNVLSNNLNNFGVMGYYISDFIHDINTSNTIEGKPIYYLVDNRDMVLGPPMKVGYLALVSCDNIRIENLEIENNIEGVLLAYTENSMIENCIFKNNGIGIEFSNSDSNTIANNTCLNNRQGIGLEKSNSNAITGCNVKNNFKGITLSGENNILTGCNVDNHHFGINLSGNSNNNIVSNCNVKNSTFCGVHLSNYSCNNTIMGCGIENNGDGIWLDYTADYNTLTNNTCMNNDNGICLLWSSNNSLINNTCENNGWYGIYLHYSSNNRIYHNNFVNNAIQAHDDGSNYWDNGYPFGGNYWSDYTGVDHYQGENQDVPASDGIGDTPYYIPGDSDRDRYPLMNSITAAHSEAVLPGTTIVDARVETNTMVTITTNLAGSITVVKYESNPGGPPPSGFTALGKYIEVRTDIPSENIIWPIEIRIYYTDNEVAETGILESNLRILYWNGSNWVREPDSGVDIDNNYVWARVMHLSPFAPMGSIVITPVIPAKIDINPDTLNLKSRGKWITCSIELPIGYSVENIDVNTIKLIVDSGSVPAELGPVGVGGHKLIVKFSRSAVQAIVNIGKVELSVIGKVNGIPFEGRDNIRVINPGH